MKPSSLWRGGRTTKNVGRRHTAKSESVEVATQNTTRDIVGEPPAEMKDLMRADVAETESKLFHTAQTIAQQVQYTAAGVTQVN